MLNQSAADLLHLQEVNFPGLCSVIAVPRVGVASMPDTKSLMRSPVSEADFDFFLEEIVLKSGYEWLDITTDFKFDTQVEEKEKPTAQGKHLTYQLPYRIPNDAYITRGKVIRAYDNQDFIVVFKERSGPMRVMGSMERGCFFRAELKTGQTRKGVNVHECGFEWESGGARPFYIEAFPLTDYFEVSGVTNTETGHDTFIQINESVYIVWGDGNSEIAHGAFELNNLIDHYYEGDAVFTVPYTYRVYHRNLATKANVNGISTYNGTVTAISGNLPPVTEMLANDNTMDAAAIEAALLALDAAGAINGTCNFEDQTPAVTPTAGMISARALLLLKGWTVNY